MTQKSPLLLGAHISIAGGFDKAIERGQSIGCTCIQIFTKSNRQWFAKPITDHAIAQFKERKAQSPIDVVVAHTAYLINIGAPSDTVREKSIEALKQELIRCEHLDIPYLVLHPGSCGTMDPYECLDLITHNLDEIFDAVSGSCMILLETMAGQGTNLCYDFEHIAYILKHSRHKNRLGVCLDTCHVFAAGYDMRTPETYAQLWDDFDRTIGLNHLRVIHVNDSKKALGSRVDRHEHIGQGALRDEPFRLLFNDPRFFEIPKILETPKESLAQDLMNMQHIASFLTDETKKRIESNVPEKNLEAMRK